MNTFKKMFYISIYDSPRSSILPSTLGAKQIKLETQSKRIKVMDAFSSTALDQLKDIKNSLCWLEYAGNPFSNFPVIQKLLKQGNQVTLDCHNSAVELEKYKLKRYLVNYVYLLILNKMFDINIVVHNRFIRLPLISHKIQQTPYPKLRRTENIQKDIDILFLCSLNSDEPVEMIFRLCKRFYDQGLRIKVTGNIKKNKNKEMEKFLFSNYLSYNEYVDVVQKSNLTICLTTRKRTLLFAPRESITLGVKCLVNDSAANRDFYGDKVFYSELIEENLFQKVQKILGTDNE